MRAQRKLGRAYLRAGAPRQALATLAKAHDNAVLTGSMDQISRIDRLAATVSKRLSEPAGSGRLARVTPPVDRSA